MLRRTGAASQRGSAPEGVPASSSNRASDDSSGSSRRGNSSGYWLPSWLCLSVSYSVLLMHLWNSYSLLQKGPSHFASLQLVLLAVNGVYILAFRSLAVQVDALLGPRTGLLPLDSQLQLLQLLQQLPASVPVSLLLSGVSYVAREMSRKSSNFKLSHLAWMGCICAAFNLLLSLLLPSGFSRFLWQTFGFCLQYFLYLCFRYFGKEFMAFQWDVLLLEIGFICCFGPAALSIGCPFATTAVVLLLRLLLFKLLFCSAISKFSAAAPHWRDLNALYFHYWTQPLPCPGSWFFYWSRGKRLHAIIVLLTEGVMSCLIFATAPFRVAAAISILGLCGGVLLSGNLGFLPHLAVALCLSLSDDSLLNAAAPAAASLTFLERCALMAGRAVLCTVVGVYFLIYTAGCLNYFCKIWMRPSVSAPSWVLALCRELSLLSICNGYGLFSVVTTGRLELVVEELHQTADRRPQWREVFLPFKPGDVNSSPPWLFSGHFPRLDWRLWFIPLRLKSALKGAVAGTPSLLQQQQLQQQQMSLNAPSPACDSCGHGASPAPAQDDPLQLYPPFWRAFVNQLSSRQPAVLQLLGQQGEVLKQLPPPVAVKVSLYDYRMTPPEGVPAYAAFFPQGWTHLTPQEILKLEKDLVHWTIGRWWMRRKQHDLDFFVFSKSCPPLEELCQY